MDDTGKNPDEIGDVDPGHLGSTLIHDGRVVHLSVDRVRFPDGSEGELELIRHRGASAVVPFLGDPEAADPKVVLVHQYRYAAGGFIYEIPAGIPMDGESWEECARRELEEETGFVAGSLRPLSRLLTTPGFTNEEIHVFLAEGLKAGSVNRDRDEFMEVLEFPFSEVLEMVDGGVIRDGKSLVGILLAERFRRTGR
ncbi:MAG: NUDIX hydrolase [Gemmatimonadetes bacterium]|nr:NUDIX hydrolase [Gemmatimonadota bacterium]NNM04305.1 NUDIX hydrolase [Gemmatimonadota bacterium]